MLIQKLNLDSATVCNILNGIGYVKNQTFWPNNVFKSPKSCVGQSRDCFFVSSARLGIVVWFTRHVFGPLLKNRQCVYEGYVLDAENETDF